MADSASKNFSNPTCSSCAKMKEALEVSKKEHTLTLRMIKEKIISTDELIKKYQEKCLESDKHLQQATDFTLKLEAAQMKIEALQGKLDRALHSTEPLRKKTNSELLSVTKLKEEQECEWRLEKQVQAHEMQTQKKSLQKSEATITKLQEQIKKEKEQNKDTSRLLNQANRRAAKLEQQLEKSKDEIQSFKLEAQLARTRGKDKTEKTPKSRRKKKSFQAPLSPKGHKQSSASGSHSEDHLEYIIEELNALNDMAPALSPLPPSPGPAEESTGESNSEAGSEDGGSDYSLGDLAGILTGDQSDAEIPVGKSLETRDSSQDFDEDLENSLKETAKGENNSNIQDNKDEPSINEAPDKSAASVMKELENFSETNRSVVNSGDETSKRETFIKEDHVENQISKNPPEKDMEPTATANVSKALISAAESLSVPRKGKRRITSPNHWVMTRSRAKAMKLSSSSDGDSSSEKETGNESFVRSGNSFKVVNTCSRRIANAKENRKSKGVKSKNEKEVCFVSFTDDGKAETKGSLKNCSEIRDRGNCRNSLSKAVNSSDDDVTPHHGNANDCSHFGVSLPRSEEQIDDGNTSGLLPKETEVNVTCYHGNDDELPVSLPGSVEPRVFRENSDAFLTAVDIPETNISTELESDSESQIKTAVPISSLKECSSDINDISLAELSDRNDASTCVSTESANIETDAEIVASATNEPNDRNLRERRSKSKATDSEQSQLKSDEFAFDLKDKSLGDNNTVSVDNLQTITKISEVDSIFADDEIFCDPSGAVVEENQGDSSGSAERNSSDLVELRLSSALHDDRENRIVLETSVPDQRQGDANSSVCKASGKLATCSPIEILTGDAKLETGLCSKESSTITGKTKKESLLDSHHIKEIFVNRKLASNRNADCFASDEAKLGSSTEESKTEGFTDQGADLREGITSLCDDSSTNCPSLAHEGGVATCGVATCGVAATTVITPSATYTESNVTHSNTSVSRFKTSAILTEKCMTQTSVTRTKPDMTHSETIAALGKTSVTHTETRVTHTKMSTRLEISAKEKLKDVISEDRIFAPRGNHYRVSNKKVMDRSGAAIMITGDSQVQSSALKKEICDMAAEPLEKKHPMEREVSLPRAMIEEELLTFSAGVMLPNLENDPTSCKNSLSEGEPSEGKGRKHSDFPRDAMSSRTVDKDERKPSVAIELDGDLQSFRNTPKDTLVSPDEVRMKSDARRVLSSSRSRIKDCSANSMQETERTDIEKQMPSFGGKSDCDASGGVSKLSGCKNKISSTGDDSVDHKGKVSTSSASPEQKRTQIKRNKTASQLLGVPETRESPEAPATTHDLQGDPPIEALLNNLEGLFEDFPSLSPLPPSPCPSDDGTDVLQSSLISNSDVKDVTTLISDAHDKCPRKRDKRSFTELISKRVERTSDWNTFGCNTRSNKEDISRRNTTVKSKTPASESISSAMEKNLLQRPLQTTLLRSREGGNVSAKRTLQRSVADSAMEKNDPQRKRAKRHLNVADRQQSPRSGNSLASSRVALNKDVTLTSGVANKRPVFASNKGTTLVDKHSNFRPTLDEGLHIKDSSKATDGKDSKFRPLSVRPSYQREVQYVIKCLGRIYENNVDLKIVFSRLTSNKCISSSTPVASGIVHFLKERRDDLMPQILKQLAQIQSEGILHLWKPVISGFESRLLEVVSLLSSEALFGNLIAQLVSLCSRSLIEASCAFNEEEMKGNLSLCRVLTALCQLKDDLSYARAVLYDIMRTLYSFHNAASELVVTIATVWPEVLRSSSDCLSAEKSPIAYTLKSMVLNWTNKPPSMDLGKILRNLCCWEGDSVTEEELRNFGLKLAKWLHEESVVSVKISKEGRLVLDSYSFEIVKSIELLSCVLGWQWTLNDLIVNDIWQILRSWAEKEEESSRTGERETASGGEHNQGLELDEIRRSTCVCLLVTDKDKNPDFFKVIPSIFSAEDDRVTKENNYMATGDKEGGKKPSTDDKEMCSVCPKCGKSTGIRLPESHIVLCIHLLGVLCRIAVENGQHLVSEIMDMLCGLIENTSPGSKVETYGIQLAAAMSLLDVSPWQPKRVASVVSTWLSALNETNSLQTPACVSQGLVCLKSLLSVNQK
ncbi:hypothetical protein AWC38_SpisGene4632 [Stylophora pistillata]|uniref:Little elongation complex subunit 1 n=1 Tax=Stylophora pistillata TaxID=50429 RepID=A0A2B4SNA9_STYPI|nr:hypothetical protein AWC38_SpisGene4632 [Stylophora pistillata]